MTSFINPSAPITWRPKIGETISGAYGRARVTGVVLESTKVKGKPAIYSAHGNVRIWIALPSGKQVSVNDLLPMGSEPRTEPDPPREAVPVPGWELAKAGHKRCEHPGGKWHEFDSQGAHYRMCLECYASYRQ